MIRITALAFIVALTSAGLARELPGPIIGRASVIDGDTIEIRGQRIRLFGIDAPESRQTCTDPKGVSYRCGQRAAQALDYRISDSPVTCEPKDRDRYGRIVAVCRAYGEDLSAWMTGLGWALAFRRYSAQYIAGRGACPTTQGRHVERPIRPAMGVESRGSRADQTFNGSECQ